jgi:capsular exopolysaccharide synthesis family protein
MRDDPEGPIAEAYRSLRANLKFALHGERQVRTLAITSCTQGEGKSLTSVDLALSFACTGKRVLVVDCDMRRPTVHKYLPVALEPGLSDVLQRRVAWRACLRIGVEPNVDVLAAGAQPRNPSDLLDSNTFAELLQELGREYDLVVVDVPPVLAVSDIESIAPRIDALLLLCKSNALASDVVADAAKRLRQVGANLIGAVLNGVGTSLVHRKYGYGYGYGYGYVQRTGARDRIAS